MYKRPQRVAAIHDLSGLGRCSLTVILPVLSAMGVQACPVPTAVLSSHTGGFGEVEFRDLTDYIPQALAHYKRLDTEFECVYSGFLGSEVQIDHCLEFFAAYPNALSVVDPVMGDHGRPYKTYTADMQRRMAELVAVADIITPNLTEAFILLKEPYSHEPLTRQKAKTMLLRLAEKGPCFVVITGVDMGGGEVCNIGYQKDKGTFWCVDCDYVPASYPGTGDIFASVLTGGFLSGDSLAIAMDRATQFVEKTVKTTFTFGTDTRDGVMLEKTLQLLGKKDFDSKYKLL
ncbi:MAG: pyridoxamine kinase [Hydrogenoanaerobacterium sp.]